MAVRKKLKLDLGQVRKEIAQRRQLEVYAKNNIFKLTNEQTEALDNVEPITQKELAQLIGYSAQSINDLENGRTPISKQTSGLFMIHKLTGRPINEYIKEVK
ncbi:hypothetical protein [Tenacibaculum phage JQ]|nr:hypothetical protein [Tenacibaculum phage JQ]